MVLDRAARRGEDPAVVERDAGPEARVHVGAPVVEDAGDVDDGPRLPAHAEQQVVVLAAVGLGAEAADVLGQGPAKGHQVADVVLAEDEVGRPVGLEEGVAAMAVVVDAVLVGVEDVRLRAPVDGVHQVQERVRSELVVVVEQRHEGPPGEGEGAVGGGGDPLVRGERLETDTAVFESVPPHEGVDLGRAGPVVHEHQLPVRIRLGADGGDRAIQEGRVGPVDGNEHADQGPRREGSETRLDPAWLGPVALPYPTRVGPGVRPSTRQVPERPQESHGPYYSEPARWYDR